MPENNFSLDFKNITGPLSKLIDSVSKGIGVLYEPRRIRKKAKAEADAKIILAKADVEVKEIEQRADRRRKYIENRRQKNLDQIINNAVQFLPAEVDNKPVEEDWMVQFFEYCKDIGNEEMQIIWSRLLAGEVSCTGTFSPRTLLALKHMRKEDAEVFTKFCSFVWKIDDRLCGRLRVPETNDLAIDIGLDPYKLTQLDNLGLVKYSYFELPLKPKNKFVGKYFDCKILFELPEKIASHLIIDLSAGVKNTNLKIDNLTDVGSELFLICGPEYNESYYNAVIRYFEKIGATIKRME